MGRGWVALWGSLLGWEHQIENFWGYCWILEVKLIVAVHRLPTHLNLDTWVLFSHQNQNYITTLVAFCLHHHRPLQTQSLARDQLIGPTLHLFCMVLCHLQMPSLHTGHLVTIQQLYHRHCFHCLQTQAILTEEILVIITHHYLRYRPHLLQDFLHRCLPS